MGNVLDRIIYAYAEAEENEIILAAKEDMKDCFWRCIAEKGQEWNFAYVLSQVESELIKLVTTTSL